MTDRPGRAFALCLAVAVAAASSVVPSAQDLDRPLDLDRSVYRRVLPNGFTYFVQRIRTNATAENPRPQRRLLLRLIVRAGSIDEGQDERGFAHFLEHMAFNGSTRFPAGQMVSYFQSVGARLGPHVNAATSYDSTTYLLDVPTDREGVLGRSFEAMRDIAGGITLDPVEIERERGVVIEEWRGRLGASSRMQGPRTAALFGDSLYADRPPIGAPDVLQSFPTANLRAFYRRHYRADRMALVAVGDVLDSVVDALMQDLFADLPSSSGPRATPPVPPHAGTRFVALTDPEAQGVSVSLVHKHPIPAGRTVGDFRQRLVRQLTTRMLQNRFNEIAARPGAPIVGAAVADQMLAGGVGAVTISSIVPNGRTPQDTVAALAEEVARLRQHGFTSGELERARRDLLTDFERIPLDHWIISEALVRHYLFDEPVPGPLARLALAKTFLPAISTSEAATLARNLFGDGNRVVISTAPAAPGADALTGAALRAALEAGATRPVTPWRSAATISDSPSTPRRPAAGSVKARREIPKVGVTVLTMSNGAEVWLKPTSFGGDVLLGAIAHGGASLASSTDFLSASLSGLMVASAGAGGLNSSERSARLAGRVVRVAPMVGLVTHGLMASARPADFEQALELMHLYFTAPNLDPSGFEPTRRFFEAAFVNQERNPGYALLDAVSRVTTNGHYAFRVPGLRDLAGLDPAVMARFYRERFANAADFTFVIVGGFDVAAITPLMATYVASLPSTGTASTTARDVRPEFPASVMRETVRRGSDPRGQTVMTFPADTKEDETETERARAAASLVQSRLMEVLREELGATYSVTATYADRVPPRGHGTITVQFGSAPDAAERLSAAALAEIRRLQTDGPSESDLRAVTATMTRALTTALSQNAYWMSALQRAALLGGDPAGISGILDIVNGLTAIDLRDAVSRYLPLDRYTVVTLLPESTTPAAPPAAR